MGLLPGALTPTLQAHLSRLGTRLSFAVAAEELGHLKGVRVAASTARRRTEADGAVYATLQDAEAARVLATAPPPPLGPSMQQVSVDGAMVGLVDGSWREVRTLAIGTVAPGRAPGTVRCADLSYCSRLGEAERFIWTEAWTAIARARRARGRPAGTITAPVASAAAIAAPRRRVRQPPSPAIPRSGPKTIVRGHPTARHPWKRVPVAQRAASAKL